MTVELRESDIIFSMDGSDVVGQYQSAFGAVMTYRARAVVDVWADPVVLDEAKARLMILRHFQAELAQLATTKCSCCGARYADNTFPGLTERTRDLRDRPIATLCVLELMGERKGAADLAERIRAREASLRTPPAEGVLP